MSATASTADPNVLGVVQEAKEGMIVLALPGTDYKMHLAVAGALPAVGVRVSGRITARAKRVDVVTTGGRFIDPVLGRPRRLQGRITATDAAANTITVFCGAPFTCELTMEKKAADYHVGDLVAFDVERGAKLTLRTGAAGHH
ncbi:MAG: hypothetical protein K8S99_03855 [Planctomycetes bacterium]|nr:hypothetical protein [Planctomycetota bacterium]